MLKCAAVVVGALLLLGFGVIDTTKNMTGPGRGLLILLGVAVAAGLAVFGCMTVVSRSKREEYSDE